MAKHATIKDIASMANVSVATVSYILNNTPGKSISEETRRRVLSAAQELNYYPSASAQRLKTNRAKCIAVRLKYNLTMPRCHQMIQGIRTYLASRGYSILLASYDDRGSLAGCMDACMSGQADGLIYIAAEGIGILPNEMNRIREWGIPVSAIDCMGSVPDVSSVVYDYYSSSRDRMDVLIQNGFRKFLYLRPAYRNYKETAREQGVRSVLLERDDITIDVRHLQFLDEDWVGRSSIRMFDVIAPALMREVREYMAGLPTDVAVVCYSREIQEMASRILFAESLRNPTPETAHWERRSISYQFPHADAGVEAARSLLNMLDGDKTPRKISLHPILNFTNPEVF